MNIKNTISCHKAVTISTSGTPGNPGDVSSLIQEVKWDNKLKIMAARLTKTKIGQMKSLWWHILTFHPSCRCSWWLLLIHAGRYSQSCGHL